MLQQPQVDPIALSIGPVSIHWYGVMYLVAFAVCWYAMRYRALRSGWTAEMVSDLLFYVAMGVVLGGRVGYILFYSLPALLADPLILFKIWQGGMSFHGGLLGVMLAMYLYGRKTGQGFFTVADSVAVVVPLGLAAGRLGNFINGELWGRATDVPWGMVFNNAGIAPRHPSQLYQFALEGMLLFLCLWIYTGKPRPKMAATGLFGVLYGIFRFAAEFFREPDAHLGFIAFDWLTMGQLLTLPMMVIGVGLIYLAYRPAAAQCDNTLT